MLYKTGRFLQLVGLLLLPVGIAGNLADEKNITVGMSLLIATIGMVIFYVGWMMARPKA